jgi:hypothetical protein
VIVGDSLPAFLFSYVGKIIVKPVNFKGVKAFRVLTITFAWFSGAHVRVQNTNPLWVRPRFQFGKQPSPLHGAKDMLDLAAFMSREAFRVGLTG